LNKKEESVMFMEMLPIILAGSNRFQDLLQRIKRVRREIDWAECKYREELAKREIPALNRRLLEETNPRTGLKGQHKAKGKLKARRQSKKIIQSL